MNSMNDLISRSALIEKLEEHIEYKEFDYYQEEPLINMSFEQLEDIICSQPTVEPVRGEWSWGILHKAPMCTNCKCEAEEETNFCPNCGCDMRGEKNDC
jgi:hypothetical protein